MQASCGPSMAWCRQGCGGQEWRGGWTGCLGAAGPEGQMLYLFWDRNTVIHLRAIPICLCGCNTVQGPGRWSDKMGGRKSFAVPNGAGLKPSTALLAPFRSKTLRMESVKQLPVQHLQVRGPLGAIGEGRWGGIHQKRKHASTELSWSPSHDSASPASAEQLW